MSNNSLSCLYGLTKEIADDRCLGEDVETLIHVYDETFQKIDVKKISKLTKRNNDKAVICMVGVQTCQYARALDLAMEFRKEGLACIIGGFHMSGCLAMLKDLPPELQKAVDNGITLVAGEIEGKLIDVLMDAYNGGLKPIYNYLAHRPSLSGVAGPSLPKIGYFSRSLSSFDAGRGCPFKCSFCTVVNIQGNIMRGRTADDIEKIIREEYKNGVHSFFITDDNFARHKDWEKIADRFIELKEKRGIRLSLMIQADSEAYKIEGFIEKMAHAGVRRVFIGLESMDAENLKSAGKNQNKIIDYVKMLHKWRDNGVLIFAGYIIGFPNDTYESIMRDVELMKRKLPLDYAEFFIMTPLPGSDDHRKLIEKKARLAEDCNLYDSMHVCFEHPKMSKEEIERAYRDAWDSFYSKEHLRTLLLRRKDTRRRILRDSLIWICSNIRLSGIHPFLGGIYRIKGRKNRRPEMPTEPLLPYYLKRLKENICYFSGLLKIFIEISWIAYKTRPQKNADYTDESLKIG